MTSLIITSISAPNAVLRRFAEACPQHGLDFIVIGDVKSPADFSLPGCRFVSIEEQDTLDFRLARILPKKHYARKNLGYLLAWKSDCIIETDDDNFPYDTFFTPRNRSVEAFTVGGKGWVNAYDYYSDDKLWPRGLPLEAIHNPTPPLSLTRQAVLAPVQQGLANQNPDVDAVFRMTRELPVNFRSAPPVALGEGVWCPFNSQNTTWFPEAFLLLYLPSYCSFRMTDIWRSFVAQRLLWTCGWPMLFHEATVWQERNEHNLLRDFSDEVPGYLHNAAMAHALEELDLKSGQEHLSENLFRCYQTLTERGWVGKEELPLVEAWIQDAEIR